MSSVRRVTKVVIAHRSAVYASALRSVLERFDDVFVEAVVAKVGDAVSAALLLDVDVVLAGHDLPDDGAVGLARGLRDERSRARVVSIAPTVSFGTALGSAAGGLVDVMPADATGDEWYAVLSARARTR